jgi:hypothetical protein
MLKNLNELSLSGAIYKNLIEFEPPSSSCVNISEISQESTVEFINFAFIQSSCRAST